MSNEELMTALATKLHAEQDRFREHLLARDVENALNRAYEYVMREDIVYAAEEMDLTDAQAEALLASSSPLAAIYKRYEKMDCSYLEDIRAAIVDLADREVDRQREAMRSVPLYPFSADWARQQDELDVYRAARQANLACKEAIEKAITTHYQNSQLDPAAAKDVLDRFGKERLLYVLAVTVVYNSWDGRFSAENKKWAKGICIVGDGQDERSDRNFDLRVGSHPGLVDLFITQVRQEVEREQKPSVRDKLQKPTPSAPKPKSPKKSDPELG